MKKALVGLLATLLFVIAGQALNAEIFSSVMTLDNKAVCGVVGELSFAKLDKSPASGEYPLPGPVGWT